MEPKLTGYATLNAGIFANASNYKLKYASAGVGAKIEKNGFYGEVECGYGTVAYAKVKAGKDFMFNDNIGIDTSLGGQYIVSSKEEERYKTEIPIANDASLKTNDLRGYGQASLIYNKPAFRASVGIRGGVKTSKQSPLDNAILSQRAEVNGEIYSGRITKGFVTPVVQMEVGKSFKGTLEASLDHLSIGAKLNIFSN